MSAPVYTVEGREDVELWAILENGRAVAASPFEKNARALAFAANLVNGVAEKIEAEAKAEGDAPRWASPTDLAEALVDEVGAELGVDTGSLSEPHFKRAVDAAAALLS